MEVGEACKDGIDAFQKPSPHDSLVFSYTSGTTGDSKGVKLSHFNLLSSANTIGDILPLRKGDTHISYLPYIHSFEQCVSGMLLDDHIRIGYYQGDAAKLIEDVMLLKPSWFPSVPRLWNRIYGIIQSKLAALPEAEKAFVDKVIQEKLENASKNPPVFTHVHDDKIFGKIKAMLGGNIKMMLTASAPLDKSVYEFLRVAFCCPMHEAYGLTEVSGGATASNA